MNKMICIYMLNIYISLFMDGSLTLDKCIKIFNERPFLHLDDNAVIYEQTKLLCSIYKRVTYYEIGEFIFNFSKVLDNISDDEVMHSTFGILTSYLGEITNNLPERIKTEVDSHIYAILNEYLLYGDLNEDNIKKLLIRNTISPEILFNLDIAESGLYKQDSIFLDSEENLRDIISKSNYNRKKSMEKAVCSTVCKNFSEDEFKSFYDTIMLVICDIGNKNLRDLYLSRYSDILKICNKFWKKQTNADTLLLNF